MNFYCLMSDLEYCQSNEGTSPNLNITFYDVHLFEQLVMMFFELWCDLEHFILLAPFILSWTSRRLIVAMTHFHIMALAFVQILQNGWTDGRRLCLWWTSASFHLRRTIAIGWAWFGAGMTRSLRWCGWWRWNHCFQIFQLECDAGWTFFIRYDGNVWHFVRWFRLWWWGNRHWWILLKTKEKNKNTNLLKKMAKKIEENSIYDLWRVGKCRENSRHTECIEVFGKFGENKCDRYETHERNERVHRLTSDNWMSQYTAIEVYMQPSVRGILVSSHVAYSLCECVRHVGTRNNWLKLWNTILAVCLLATKMVREFSRNMMVRVVTILCRCVSVSVYVWIQTKRFLPDNHRWI